MIGTVLKLIFCVTVATPVIGFVAIAALVIAVVGAISFITWDMSLNMAIIHSMVNDMTWVKFRSVYLLSMVIGVIGWLNAGKH